MDAIYTEDDATAKVEIVEDRSDNEWERYLLKIIEPIQQSRIFHDWKIGETFEVCNKKNSGFRCWYLEKIMEN
jgi:hypothetical protein